MRTAAVVVVCLTLTLTLVLVGTNHAETLIQRKRMAETYGQCTQRCGQQYAQCMSSCIRQGDPANCRSNCNNQWACRNSCR
jgi:hypothetical protein